MMKFSQELIPFQNPLPRIFLLRIYTLTISSLPKTTMSIIRINPILQTPISDHLKSPQIHNHVTSFNQLSNFSLSLKSQNPPTHSKSSISNLTFISFNVRSILSKLDEISAICSIHSPDIICKIVKSWLSPDIPNSELFFPNYSAFRCDRNRHGGGILIYTKCCVTEIQLNTNLEFILSIKLELTTYNLGTFYRPPSLSVNIVCIDLFFSSKFSTLSNLILLGDFNVDYAMNSPLRSKIITLSECLSLIQIVKEAARFSHSGNSSIIDLVFLSSSIKPVSYNILPPPISSSDHNTILFSISSENHSQPTRHSVWLYNDEDFNHINFLLDSIAWKDILPSNDANTSWLIFKYICLTIVCFHVPQKKISTLDHPLLILG